MSDKPLIAPGKGVPIFPGPSGPRDVPVKETEMPRRPQSPPPDGPGPGVPYKTPRK